MPLTIEVILGPAEIESRRRLGFAGVTCVVFDVLRATSVIIEGLASGAKGYCPVEEISEALQLCKGNPEFLLAGERNGLRITAAQTGGVEFDLGNSPREHSSGRVAGRTVVITTTNGPRALRACAGAKHILASAFLNLNATADWIESQRPGQLVLVCAGTADAVATEDVLAAGALCHRLLMQKFPCELSDAAALALHAFHDAKGNLAAAIGRSRNGRRLLAIPELKEDVEFCLRENACPLVALLDGSEMVKRQI